MASLARSRELAALSASERDKRRDLSLILAVEALRADKTHEARNGLLIRSAPAVEFSRFCTPAIAAFLEWRSAPMARRSRPTTALNKAAAWCCGKRLAERVLANAPLEVKEGDVRSVAFSPDGKTIAAGYSVPHKGGGVVLWEAASRKRLGEAPLDVKEGHVSSVAFSPDGKTIAAGYHVDSSGGSGGVVLWEAASRNGWRMTRSK